MTILRLITAFLVFPGTYLRAFSEHMFLKILKVPVEDTKYLQKNELCGHIEHRPIESLGKSFAASFLPGILLCLMGLSMAVFSGLQLFYLGITPRMVENGSVSALFILCVVMYYFGISLLCNVFPGYEDALYLWENYTECKNPAAKIFLFLPVIVIRAGAFLERFGVPVLCAIGLTVLFIFI